MRLNATTLVPTNEESSHDESDRMVNALHWSMSQPKFFCIAFGWIILTSCVSQTVEERLSKMGPVQGRADVNFVVSSSEGIDLRNTADLAQTLGKYRRLKYSEAEKVRLLAQEKFDGFLIEEIQNLRPVYEARKRAIRRQAKSPAQESAQIAELDREIREQAVIAVKRRYGAQIAVPLSTRDRKPAVAIAKIDGDKVVAPKSAVELDKKPGVSIQHEGRNTSVTESSVDIP